MPHYKDGTEAKVGDIIKGKPYNTPHEVVGVVVRVTPDSESCNLVVAFTTRYGQGVAPECEAMPAQKTDYGDTKAFEKLA